MQPCRLQRSESLVWSTFLFQLFWSSRSPGSSVHFPTRLLGEVDKMLFFLGTWYLSQKCLQNMYVDRPTHTCLLFLQVLIHSHFLTGLEYHLSFMAVICFIALGLHNMDNAVRSLVLHGILTLFRFLCRVLAHHTIHLRNESRKR